MTHDEGIHASSPDRPEAAGPHVLPRPVAAVIGGGGVLGAAHAGIGYAAGAVQ
ncbi:hypothetical protein [Nonomuraea sp. NPDC049480]|uniref:hypothetical protein n=1 Tax=Nonomuraea sp. NPDC049480 TaxID=3364353 RepID=UPI00379D99F7